ncbi:hypothetical protein [Sphingobium sp. LSP13-1-1.1]|uniref:hypothetical protein n=1 Tax=Sphingobium sp. LSP13-1-1.1 TaxID=3135234 RepID=UPI0034436515
MSAGVCIPDLIEQGKIPKGKGAAALTRYQQLLNVYDQQMGGAAAEALATSEVLKVLENEALLKKRRTLLQVKAQQTAAASLNSFAGGRKPGAPIDPRAGVALFDRDGRASYSNVEGRRQAVRGRAHAMMDQILSDHSRNLIGHVRNRAQLGDIVRELFGQDSGNLAAKEMADAWSRTAEMLRQRFNAAGGDIGRMEKWGLPQSHDSRAVRRAGFDAWRASIEPRLDRARMIDRDTGQPFVGEAWDAMLRDVFDTIRSEGWNKREAGSAGRGSMASRHGDPRFLIFKGADEWQAYQADFGGGATAFDAMMGHIDGMSQEIAAMEILGPNPNATVQWVKDTIEKSAQLDSTPDSKAVDKAHKGAKQIDRLWDELTGASHRPESRGLSLFFSSIRSIQTAAKLGSASLSAVTDLAFQFSTRRYNGLPAAAMIRDYVKLMRPGSRADQRLAVRLGLIAEEWGQRAAAQGRYLNEELTAEWSRRLAEGVLRASGLSRWTQAGRWAFGMEFMGHITDESVKAFDKLDAPFRGVLERNGIDAAVWDKIRSTPLEMDRGVPWLKPSNVEDRELGDRLLEMILSETNYAVPTPDLKTRAMMSRFAPRGTLWGELMRTSPLLFKSFGISMLLMQQQRLMEQSAGNAMRYAGGLVIGTTLMGALAMQLKAIASGKDPMPMTDSPLPTREQLDDVSQLKRPKLTEGQKFWGAALAQGGGFGIMGDFLSSTQNRFGGGLAGSVAGPLAQDLQAAADVANSKNPGWKAVRLARQELPGGSLWYAKLAFDRLVTDQIQEEIDPSYRSAWRRMEKRAREQRTQYFWAPGETAPDHAPDLTAIAGETMQ